MDDDEIGMDVDHLYSSYTIRSGSHIPTIKNTAQTSYRAAQNFPHISVKKKLNETPSGWPRKRPPRLRSYNNL